MTREEKEAELKRLAKKQERIKKKIDKFFADVEDKAKANPFVVASTICRLVIDASKVQLEIRKVVSIPAYAPNFEKAGIEAKGNEEIIIPDKEPELIIEKGTGRIIGFNNLPKIPCDNSKRIDWPPKEECKRTDHIQKLADEFADLYIPKEQLKLCEICGRKNCINNKTCINCGCQF